MEGVWGEVGRVEGSGDDKESAKAVIYICTHSLHSHSTYMYQRVAYIAVEGTCKLPP